MAKFKIGDIIKANEMSNKEYLVTNQKTVVQVLFLR